MTVFDLEPPGRVESAAVELDGERGEAKERVD